MIVSVLIAAFNEAPSVGQTVLTVRKALSAAAVEHEIIVIDDGSSDRTGPEAEGAGAIVLTHPMNRGYGRALKSGLQRAAADLVAIIDADGSYPAEALPGLIARTTTFDMVVGARQGAHYRGSRAKWLGRLALERMVLFVTGVRVPDVNSGLRVFRKRIALDHIDQIGNGFSFTTTLTLAMLLEGHFVEYVPVPYHARVGASKVRFRRDVLRTIQILTNAVLAYNPVKLFLLLSYIAVAGLSVSLLIDWFVAGAVHAGLIVVLGVGWVLLLFGMGLLGEALRRLR
jgi:glycosyltransferase involved in cell wall biosynthesis